VDYIVKIDEHIFFHEPPAGRRTILGRSDVFVATQESARQPTTTASTLYAPTQVTLPLVDLERLSFLEIRDRRDRRLITVIELLSPTNKYSGPNREQYLGKRGRLLTSSTHLIEIDLLRCLPRMPFAEPLPESAYCVMVSRMEKRPQADFWPIRLQDRLPVIPIPLRASEAEAELDLQTALHHVYDAARYEKYIYESSPQPALNATDDAWARRIIDPS
jgi:hypothetical protein